MRSKLPEAPNFLFLSHLCFHQNSPEHEPGFDAMSFSHLHIPPANVNHPEPYIHRLPSELLQQIFLFILRTCQIVLTLSHLTVASSRPVSLTLP
jgi:hypothetical protein